MISLLLVTQFSPTQNTRRGKRIMLTLWRPLSGRNGFSFVDFALPGVTTSTRVAADVIETKDALLVKMDLPGVDPAAIKVGIEKDVLTVSAQRKAPERKDNAEVWHRSEIGYGELGRSFTLPATIDGGRTEARYESGVLTLTLPKREEAKPRKIEVK